MGWRSRRSIKDSNGNSLDVARREARKAFLALSSDAGSNTARSKLTKEDNGEDLVNPKQDLYGLDYDPFKQAPDLGLDNIVYFSLVKSLCLLTDTLSTDFILPQFVPRHKFPASADNDGKNAEIPQPEDNNLKVLIEGVATLVSGKSNTNYGKRRRGLGTKDSGGSSDMSEAFRACERLEFEEAAVQKAKLGNERQVSTQLIKDLSSLSGLQFTAGGVESFSGDRPAPILCKRFDLIDPYMGKVFHLHVIVPVFRLPDKYYPRGLVYYCQYLAFVTGYDIKDY
ncbi:hypothetical protein SASPL_136990 [Salvia splendens]|uniref:Uncharacterized protein n=1 Tax=Salvia splendens TaxID=180675 RepID=A0A8X8WSI9_SALSN|nr:hypothetical protein SASPL_136990 [Salvia splendens]